MPIGELTTRVSVGEAYGRGIPNLTLEEARFFGRPNFAGELDQFKDNRRKFTVLIPNELADTLRDIGYNVKTKIPTPEDLEKGFEMVSHLKVFLNFKIPDDKRGWPNELDFEEGPEIHVIRGDDVERLTSRTVAILDRSRLENLDMEIRGWEYDREEQPGQYSARLVKLVATLRPNILDQKYGNLR